MKKTLIILSALIASYTNCFGLDIGTFKIEHNKHTEVLSYKLPITQEFKKTFVDTLKTGKTVKVLHKVKIRPVDQWFGWLAEKNYTKYYKYNLINNQYFVGVNPTNLKPVISMQSIVDDITGIKNAPFLPSNVLAKDKAYEIDFTISINPIEQKSSNLLLFKGEGLKERLHSAVHYINK